VVRRIVLVLLIAAALSALGRRGVEALRRRLAGTVTVATLNVQTLFDARYDGGEFDEFNPYASDWNEYAYRARLRVLAEAVSGLTPWGPPDILALQEIEHSAVLNDLVDAIGGVHYPYALCAPGASTMRVCIISRFPFVTAQAHGLQAALDRKLRPMLEVRVDSPSGPLRVIAAHWKSAREGRRATEPLRRLAARAARRRLDALFDENPAAQIILAGDLNTEIRRYDDSHTGVSKNEVSAAGPPSLSPQPGAVLRVRTSPPAALTAGVLYSPWDELGPGSYAFRGRFQAIDHLLFAPSFFQGNTGLRYESAHLSRDWAGPQGMPLRYESFRRAGVTDHFAVWATLSGRE